MRIVNSNFKMHRKGIMLCTFIIAAMMTMLSIALETGVESHYTSQANHLQVGTIADYDVAVVSSVDVIDQEKTAVLRQQSRDAVLPVYAYSASDSLKSVALMDNIRKAATNGDWKSLEKELEPSLIGKLMSYANVKNMSLAYSMVSEIAGKGVYRYEEILATRNKGAQSILVVNNYSDDGTEHTANLDDMILTDRNLAAYIDGQIAEYGETVSVTDKTIIKTVVSAICSANVFYDNLLTEQRITEADEATVPVILPFAKGDLIVKTDTVITQEQIDTLLLLGSQATITVADEVGNFIFFFICVFMCFYVFSYLTHQEDAHFSQYLFIMTLITSLTIVASFFCQMFAVNFSLPFRMCFMPLLFVPLFVAEITGLKRVGLICSFLIGICVVVMPEVNVLSFFYWVIKASACVALLRFFNRRVNLILQWLVSILICCGITALFMFFSMEPFDMVWLVFAQEAAMTSVVYILLAVLLPLFEYMFNLPTTFRLNELAYGYSPLMEKLSKAAPGTYNHSRAVSEIAEAGARAIGANAYITKVGGLYHDIGKTEHPEYFTENNPSNSKHEALNPSLSASVIKNHVTVGEHMGKDARLPSEIIDIIANHHGNDVIMFFYYEAQQKENTDKEDVQRSDYTYSQSVIPSTRECAIVMLADSVEAASRNTPANPVKYEKLISKIFMDKIAKHQLDNSQLTMDDLNTLKQSFINSLIARNHSRVEYPEEATQVK